MPDASGPAGSIPIPFVAELRPHRSLGPAGFRVMLAAVAVVIAVYGGIFLAMGAWPVFGFLGLEVLLLYLLFRLNFRDARRCETIRIDRDATEVRKRAPSGHETRHDFQTGWLRVEVERPARHDCRLTLASHGRRVSVGSFLTPPERHELGGVLRRAVAVAAKRG
ncbi:MAG: DUF2244 domain-containing protein [Acetobacterales bacterium]